LGEKEQEREQKIARPGGRARLEREERQRINKICTMMWKTKSERKRKREHRGRDWRK
jgi:hypothetical protein